MATEVNIYASSVSDFRVCKLRLLAEWTSINVARARDAGRDVMAIRKKDLANSGKMKSINISRLLYFIKSLLRLPYDNQEINASGILLKIFHFPVQVHLGKHHLRAPGFLQFGDIF